MDLLQFYELIVSEQKQIETTLAELRELGREKTVRYKEYMCEKLLNNSMIEKIKKYIDKR